MTFHLTTLPAKFLGYGSSFGPQHSTTILRGPGGQEYRGGNWRHARRHYDVRKEGVSLADLRELQGFVSARAGAAHSFLLVDPLDSTTAADRISTHAYDDVRLGTGDGTTGSDGTAQWFCVTRYGEGTAFELTRRIHKTTAISVGVDGVELTSGVHYNPDHSLGAITFTAGNIPTRGQAITIGAAFSVEVRFTMAADVWLATSMDAYDAGALSAPMIEQKITGNQGHDRPIHGAAKVHASAAMFVLEWQQGYYHEIAPSAAADVYLPDVRGRDGEVGYESSIACGGPYFYVFNASDTYTITLKELTAAPARTAILQHATIAPRRARKLWLDQFLNWRAF